MVFSISKLLRPKRSSQPSASSPSAPPPVQAAPSSRRSFSSHQETIPMVVAEPLHLTRPGAVGDPILVVPEGDAMAVPLGMVDSPILAIMVPGSYEYIGFDAAPLSTAPFTGTRHQQHQHQHQHQQHQNPPMAMSTVIPTPPNSSYYDSTTAATTIPGALPSHPGSYSYTNLGFDDDGATTMVHNNNNNSSRWNHPATPTYHGDSAQSLPLSLVNRSDRIMTPYVTSPIIPQGSPPHVRPGTRMTPYVCDMRS